MTFMEAVEILGPIRVYFDTGGTLDAREGKGWCLDGKQIVRDPVDVIIAEAERMLGKWN